MNNYFSIFNLSGDNTSQTEKLRFFLVHLFVFFLPFDKFYTTLILYLLILATVIDLNKARFKNIPRQFWIFQLIFWISLAGYFYSYSKTDAGFLIERQLAILILPLLLPLAINITKGRIDYLLITLTISCTITILGLFCYAIFVLSQLDLPISNIFSDSFFNHNFSAPIGIHAGYLSIYISISLIFLLTKLTKSNHFEKMVIGLVILILAVGILFLVARNVMIYTAIVILFIYPLVYVKKKIIYIATCLIVITASYIFITSNEYLKDRFSISILEDINFDKNKQNIEILEPRSDRWLLSLDLIKSSPIIGYGTGDEVIMLKKKYQEKKYVVSFIENYNVHNQYLSILIKHGIIGLLIFLGAFVYYFNLAIKHKDFMYFIFLFGICFSFLTENVLDSNKGIFFFALLNTMFGYNLLKSSQQQKINNETIS